LLPISPKLCIFFYDPGIYKVGSRNKSIIDISLRDVEIINSLQIQSVDRYILFQDKSRESDVGATIQTFSKLKKNSSDCFRKVKDSKNEKIFQFRALPTVISRNWSFCHLKKHRNAGDKRDPLFSKFAGIFIDYIECNHKSEDARKLIQNLFFMSAKEIMDSFVKFFEDNPGDLSEEEFVKMVNGYFASKNVNDISPQCNEDMLYFDP